MKMAIFEIRIIILKLIGVKKKCVLTVLHSVKYSHSIENKWNLNRRVLFCCNALCWLLRPPPPLAIWPKAKFGAKIFNWVRDMPVNELQGHSYIESALPGT